MNAFLVLASLLLLYILGQWHRSKRAKKKVLCIVDNNCTGCRRCIKRCQRKALEMVNESGLHVTLKYSEKCTACGDCVAGCKFKALKLVNRE